MNKIRTSLALTSGLIITFITATTLMTQSAAAQGQRLPSQADGQLRIYIDPATGQPTDPPTPASATPPARRVAPPPDTTSATSTSSEGLRLRKGTTEAGGVVLDLGGRFQDEVRVTNQPQGRRVECTRPGTETPCTDPRGSADAHP